MSTTLARLGDIDRAPLDQLMKDFPALWKEVGARLMERSSQGPEALGELVHAARNGAKPWRDKVRRSQNNPMVVQAALPKIAAARMTMLAVERMLQSASTGVEQGTVRLGLWSGALIQRLLFSSGLQRKPASLRWLRALWPVVFDRRKLMPLVQQRGIYCFYSRELISALARHIAGRPCVEIAAGDGTLSRFLNEAGVAVHATDDHSWAHAVEYGNVTRLDAVSAVKTQRPSVVLCSFPPPGNTFEARVLDEPCVHSYVVITTRHRFAAGDWNAYERTGWNVRVDEAMSAAVWPPEVDPVVLVLERARG